MFCNGFCINKVKKQHDTCSTQVGLILTGDHWQKSENLFLKIASHSDGVEWIPPQGKLESVF